jgi:hypothetical protein
LQLSAHFRIAARGSLAETPTMVSIDEPRHRHRAWRPRDMYGYKSPPSHEQLFLRVRVCESEITAFGRRFPTLTHEQIFAVMLEHGPLRSDVEAALTALAGSERP